MASDGPAGTESGRPKKILIVDDDASVRDGLARALSRRNGYVVDTARDGLDAGLKLASFQPDLVILDVVMPGMGGLEVCRRIRSIRGLDKMKIVILTGYPGGSNPEKSLILSADLFLTKPQSLPRLCAHLEELLGE